MATQNAIGSDKPIQVSFGGTGIATLTDHAVLLGSGTGAITPLAVGSTGETIMGATGADCSWTNSPSFGGSITAGTSITATAGDLTLTDGDALIGNKDVATTSPIAYFKKYRGAAALTSGDLTGTVKFGGYDGTQVTDSARITSTSSGTIASTRVAGNLQFYTHPDSAAADPTLRMTIASTGAITVAAPDAGTALTVTAGGITCSSGDVVISSGNLTLPATSATIGQITLSGSRFLHAYGATSNVCLGTNAGNLTGLGSNNILIGSSCGSALDGSAHSNIYLGNITYSGSPSHTIVIGMQGTGDGQQDQCYIAGIYPQTGITGRVVLINSSYGQLGAVDSISVANGGTGAGTLTDHAVLLGSGTSAITPMAVGATGETIMGSTGADCTWTSSPSFGGSVTAGTSVTASNGNVVVTSGNLTLPTTTSSVGQITINSNRMLHAYGTGNIFLGESSGNFTLTTGSAVNNTATGKAALDALTTGDSNCSYGYQNLTACTTGIANTAYGYNALYQLTTGSYNVAIGNSPGSAYTGAESSNILIGSPTGTLGESNKIRIGINGSGAGQQNATYVAGIYGVTPGGTLNVALIDSNNQLGSVASLGVANGGTGTNTLTDHGILLGSGTGAITPLGSATDGQIPIGSTGADPVLATITAGTNVTITNAAGSITIATAFTVGINTQTDSYTLVIGDAGKIVRMNKGTANNLTVPLNASVAFPTGTQILVEQVGAGVTTIVATGGVTINSAGALMDLFAQYSVCSLIKTDTDTWELFGDLG